MGKLRIDIDSPSYLLKSNFPVEIRNDKHALVKTVSGGRTVDLKPGLYSVNVVLEDGRAHRKVVQVRSGETEPVQFKADPPAQQEDNAGMLLRGPRGGPAVGVSVSEVEGARVISSSDTEITFGPVPNLRRVPVARLTLATSVREVSLPVNPRGHGKDGQCTVTAISEDRVQVSLSPHRTVSSTLEQMVRSGKLMQGAELATTARDLLQSKYQDPVGAAYGGLLLQRLGRLTSRESWVRNLARDFAWLPDGRVLLAWLLARSEEAAERAQGLDHLLRASGQRMMFADGFSLSLELLRRWPDEARQAEREQRLAASSAIAAAMDWDAGVMSVDEYLRRQIERDAAGGSASPAAGG